MIGYLRVVATALMGAAALPVGAQTYGDTLVAAIAAAHPDVAAIEINATGRDGKAIRISWGTAVGASSSASLDDAAGEPIGTITITGRTLVDARPLARAISRRIYVVDNLAEPDPFVAGAERSVRGQALVDAAIDANADLITLAMHVALPGADNRIIASNFGRIGKAADKDDADVITNGSVHREATNGGRRLAVELPMLDARRRVIGALSTSFSMTATGGEARALARAIAVRDALASRIPSLSWLAGK